MFRVLGVNGMFMAKGPICGAGLGASAFLSLPGAAPSWARS